jgi:ABC-type phosphate transport system permease subunit
LVWLLISLAGHSQHHLRYLGFVRAWAPLLQAERDARPDCHISVNSVLQDLFAGPPFGIGVFTAGLILAIMTAALHQRDYPRRVQETVPPVLKRSCYGLGATNLGVLWNVVLPYARAAWWAAYARARARPWRDHGGHAS